MQRDFKVLSRMNAGIDSSFLSGPQDATHALVRRHQAWIHLIAFSAHVSASSGCVAPAEALPGCCRLLAEMIDRVVRRNFRACQIRGGDYEGPIGTATR